MKVDNEDNLWNLIIELKNIYFYLREPQESYLVSIINPGYLDIETKIIQMKIY